MAAKIGEMPKALFDRYALKVRAQAGGPLTAIPEGIIATAQAQARQVTKGQGGRLAWPGLLRRLARHTPGWDA